MPKKPVPKLPYDVPWILQRIRAFLLGREYNSALRWPKDMAPKSQPQPELPHGPSSKVRFNYYCDRDPRGEVKRPQVLYDVEVQRQRISGGTRSVSGGCSPLNKWGDDDRVTETGGKEEKGAVKKGEDEKVAGEKLGKEEVIVSKVEGKEGDIIMKTETKVKETNKEVAGKDMKNISENKEKKLKDTKAGENGEEMDKNEKEELEVKKEKRETISSGAIKRVPGKVFHWDTIDGKPDEQCCRKKQDV